MGSWQDKWEQCWPLLVAYLQARDLICLSLSSRSTSHRLASTPGLWQQACLSCLCASAAPPPVAATSSSSAPVYASCSTPQPTPPATGAAADQQAREVLFAMTALAHHIKGVRSPPPQTVPIPPWLPGQPGICRGFTRVEPSSLDPPLLLDATQLGWLAHGSLSGHTSGVFISSCSSSPRSQRPCAFLAALVSNKVLLAELYIPRHTTTPDPWVGLLSQQGGSSSSSGEQGAVGCSQPRSYNPAGDAAALAGFELWLSSAVQLQQQQQQQDASCTGAAAAAGGGGSRGGRGGGGRGSSRGRRGRQQQGSGGGSSWADIHKLIMDCIGDNASRCTAVRGTTVVPPGTPAAAAIEQRLARLTAAGGPVLDFRRLQWEPTAAAAEAGGSCRQNRAAAAGSRHLQQQQQQQQQQQVLSWPWGWVSTGRACRLPRTPTDAAAASNHKQQPQQQQLHPSAAPSSDWGWQAAAGAALQSALACVHVQAAAAGEGGQCEPFSLPREWQASGPADSGGSNGGVGGSNGGGGGLEGDSMPELLAALVERLPEAAPDVQLLVLPVLLPGGRAAQRVPSIGGSRLSAPKLLCLNVPCLMALRKHAWGGQLPALRHVLLLVGPPAPLPAPAPVTIQQQHHHQQQQAAEQSATGGWSAGPDTSQGGSRGGGSAGPREGGQVVHGTFTLQELEQQWQAQLQLGQSCADPQQQQQQQAPLWEEEQQDAWFEQQVAHQRPSGWRSRQHQCQADTTGSALTSGGCAGTGGCGAGGAAAATAAAAVVGGSATPAEQVAPLSRAAVDALHDMVHSCMDRTVVVGS